MVTETLFRELTVARRLRLLHDSGWRRQEGPNGEQVWEHSFHAGGGLGEILATVIYNPASAETRILYAISLEHGNRVPSVPFAIRRRVEDLAAALRRGSRAA